MNYPLINVPPSPLRDKDGKMISSAFEWVSFQRKYIFQILQDQIYGKIPPLPDKIWTETISCCDVFSNMAVRKEIRLHFCMNSGKEWTALMLLYIPKSDSPVPVFLGLNFKGNDAATKDSVHPSDHWVKKDEELFDTSRWVFEECTKRGYASATVCYHDFFQDSPDGAKQSIYTLFPELNVVSSPHPCYTAVGAWAWGLSRMLDALSHEPLIDISRAAVHGHSRLGKTALWAGACDTRFKIVISNDSGCTGASLARQNAGETIESINRVFPHWFVEKYHTYSNKEAEMPFDQHFLISLIAPRICCVGSAVEDTWANPPGEFLSCYFASPVYRLFGNSGIGADYEGMPEVGSSVTGGGIHYHIRKGIHDQNLEDWENYWEVADRYFI